MENKSIFIKRAICNRCGVCCIQGCCKYGEYNESTGVCSYLRFDSTGMSSCMFIHGLNTTPDDIGMGGGCYLRVYAPEAHERILKDKELLLTNKNLKI